MHYYDFLGLDPLISKETVKCETAKWETAKWETAKWEDIVSHVAVFHGYRSLIRRLPFEKSMHSGSNHQMPKP